MAECYISNPVDFNNNGFGAHMYTQTLADGTGVTDSATGMMSVWVEIDPTGTNQQIYRQSRSGVGGFILQLLSDGTIGVIIFDTSTLVQGATVGTYTDGWNHILMAWDFSVPTWQLYINDVAPTFNHQIPFGNTGIVVMDVNPAIVGATLITGGEVWRGCMAEIWLHHSDYLDISTEANRRLFIDAQGFPADLGSDGSTPTGTQPLVYLKTADPNFHLNSGLGGDFGVNAGQEPCVLSPSLPRPPEIVLIFEPPTTTQGTRVTKMITIDSECNVDPMTGISFVDTLPDGLVIANPANTSNTCGGTLTANPGESTISLSGATITPGGS